MGRRPTIVDVAREAGVSKSTVSLVLQGSPLVKRQTRETVEAAMTAVGYVYNRTAATLRGKGRELIGLVINWTADARLFSLPRGRDGGYTIPRGGLYELVSCPNYLGELLEWAGFALAAGSLAGASFFVWSAANLLPRALAHHAWYRSQFPDYPPSRKALVPFLV